MPSGHAAPNEVDDCSPSLTRTLRQTTILELPSCLVYVLGLGIDEKELTSFLKETGLGGIGRYIGASYTPRRLFRYNCQ
jgi:hypothetical protein